MTADLTMLETIRLTGNQRNAPGVPWPDSWSRSPNWITCVDGFKLSVLAGPGAYYTPKPELIPSIPANVYDGTVDTTYSGPYTHVEVGFPSQRPEPWSEWEPYAEEPDEPTNTAYPFVPIELVHELVNTHGGEANGTIQR